jgi:hypothetical protein
LLQFMKLNSNMQIRCFSMKMSEDDLINSFPESFLALSTPGSPPWLSALPYHLGPHFGPFSGLWQNPTD